MNPSTIRWHLFFDESVIELIDEPALDHYENHLEIRDDGSHSEPSGDYGEVTEMSGPVYTGKDKITKWSNHCPPSTRRTSEHNLVWQLPGVRCKMNLDSPVQSWVLFFRDYFLDDIVKSTH